MRLLLLGLWDLLVCCCCCYYYYSEKGGGKAIVFVLFLYHAELSNSWTCLRLFVSSFWILDSFALLYHQSVGAEIAVPLLRKGITWYTDKNVKFHNPQTNSTLQQAFEGISAHALSHTAGHTLAFQIIDR